MHARPHATLASFAERLPVPSRSLQYVLVVCVANWCPASTVRSVYMIFEIYSGISGMIRKYDVGHDLYMPGVHAYIIHMYEGEI